VRRLSLQNKSLFIILLGSFLLIYLVSFSLNMVTTRLYSDLLHKEIINHNRASLKNATESYENHFLLLRDTISNFYFARSDIASAIWGNSTKYNYPYVNQMVDQFLAFSSNMSLFIEDFFVNIRNAVLIDKSGISTSKEFSEKYRNDRYNLDFWDGQYDNTQFMSVFPAESFMKTGQYNQISETEPLLPVIFKNKMENNHYFGILLNTETMYRHVMKRDGNAFFIVGPGEQVLFDSARQGASFQARFSQKEGVVTRDDSYLFYEKGAVTGLYYISEVPLKTIKDQVDRLQLTLILITVGSIVISLLIAIIISKRIQSPIHFILEQIKERQPVHTFHSKIKEFKEIQENISNYNKDLQAQKSLMVKFGIMDRVKNIRNLNNVIHHVDVNQKYYLILYELTALKQFEELPYPPELLSSRIFELINAGLSVHDEETLTFQMEPNLFASVISFKTCIIEEITKELSKIKQILDHDSTTYFMTIAFNPASSDILNFNSLYGETLDMLKQRSFGEGTQIITEALPIPGIPYLSPLEDNEFGSQIMGGNDKQAVQIISRSIGRLAKCRAWAFHYQQFAYGISSKINMILLFNNIAVEGAQENFKQFTSVRQFEEYFAHTIVQAVRAIKETQQGQDAITDFVKRYIEENYGSDIYQDLIADKLNISSNYLSNYFKEKTGVNFSEYLNRVRIEKAKYLLEFSNLNIKEVAEKVGYQNANSFTRMFRKTLGMTPGDYRYGTRMKLDET